MAAIARFILNYKDTHPNKEGVAIDYTIAMVLLPAIIIGSTVGVILHSILPEIICSIMLVLLLLTTATKSYFKGRVMWREESL